MVTTTEQKFQECTNCGEEKLLSSFYQIKQKRKDFKNEYVFKVYYRKVCKACEFKKRQNKKFETKAANAIYNHAEALGFTVSQMSE